MSHLMTKPIKWHVRPAKTQISLGIRRVWSESSLSAWRKIRSLDTYWAHSEDSDLTGRMPRLIWVFNGAQIILLVLSRGSSYITHAKCLWYSLHYNWPRSSDLLHWQHSTATADLFCEQNKHVGRVKRIWYLSPMRAAKVQVSLRIRAVSLEPLLLAHTSSESRGTFRQKARSLAPLNGWACTVKIFHDGMLEDTNSLDGAHVTIFKPVIFEPLHEKTCLWDFRPSKTQTGLLSYTD